MVGDFNESLLSSYQRGGTFVQSRADRFHEFLQQCAMIPMHTVGLKYSWVRRVGGRVVMSKKLDWCLGDHFLNVSFSNAVAENLTRIHSDHSPLLVRCGGFPSRQGDRPFRFEAAWITHPEYASVVEGAWCMGSLNSKLLQVQQQSTVFNRDVFGHITKRKKTLEARISGIQRRSERVDSASLSILHNHLHCELDAVLAQEELLWFQKSREQQTLYGGRNTKYFHTQALIKWRRNKIHSLILPTGEVCSEDQTLQREATRFFKELFCASTNVTPLDTSSVLCPLLGQIHVSRLMAEVTKEEVWEAVSTMGPYKSPGPDGFQAVLFKTYWHILGDDVWKLVRDAFVSGSFDPLVSETLIALIPKVDVPKTFKELRPISLCNVLYKIITKVLVLRLRPCLQEIVGPLQSSFILGRGTTDNAIILQEVVHFMRTKTKRSKNVIFKLDLEKAYDRVDWGFLEETLKEFGFPPMTVALIMFCVSSTSLSLIWNGTRLPPFRATRGLRQGDPLSPYLFVLCMERLAHMIHHEVEENNWKPVTISRGGPGISHLFFADDVLLFAKAEIDQIRVVHQVLERFCGASGLKINLAKSKAMASWCVDMSLRNRIVALTSIPFTENFDKYLGFPIYKGRARREDFQFVVDRVTSRLATWKVNLLNKPARVTLAKSVLTAIPVYVMQLNWLPQAVCDNLDAVVRRFVWGTATGNGVSMLAWKKVLQPRRNGGLGIRSARMSNVALLGKQLWNLVQRADKFWVKTIEARYAVGPKVLTTGVRDGSVFWKAMVRTGHLLRDGFSLRIGNGRFSFWFEDWSPFGRLCDRVPFVDVHDLQLTLRYVFASGSFDAGLLYTAIHTELADFLGQFQNVVCVEVERDCLIWTENVDGEYSVKAGYHWLLNREVNPIQVVHPWRQVWQLQVPENIRFFMWQALHNIVPTVEQLVRRRLAVSDLCKRCKSEPETLMHCVRDCPLARKVWHAIGFVLPVSFFSHMSFADWVQGFHGFGLTVLMATIWVIWKQRCRFIFAGDLQVVHQTVREVHVLWEVLARVYPHTAPSKQICFVRWQPPIDDFVALNTDESSFGNPGESGFGGVVRSSDGVWRVGFAGHIGVSDCLHAELLALLHGLDVCWIRRCRKVEVFTHSRMALGLITGYHSAFHKYEAVISRVKLLLKRDWDVRCRHLLREGNAAADFMAKLGVSLSSSLVVFDVQPPGIVPILRTDCMGTWHCRQ
ncbi:uncharacterized protein LOC130713176 [Lotus japonicus]|uniref:uncharacterized protein LOC130713176 n=1 Tax=Lotus japonicus TaxID=34305 RepID=UPI0025840B88|nr:uncharacterized protein LOC130713176 [Lotus japonicus]